MRHPVETLLREHAYNGTTPTADEIAELKLGPTARAAIERLAAEVHELHRSGEQGQAHALAHEQSRAIIDTLPEAQKSADYLAPDPNDGLENLGPRELAAKVPSYYSLG